MTRNGRTESWIFGAAAVATPAGRLVAQAGDPHLATYVRSAAKPFQILPLLLAGGVERFRLEPADLALICASHGGRPEHAERAARLLERGGFGVADLLCGAHAPFDRAAARKLRERGEEPSALHNNCSGKHAGMLLACRLLNLPTAISGRVIGKEGAEGFYAMAVREPFPLGLAFKIADGGERGRDGVALELLRQMGAISGAELAALDDLSKPPIRTVRGRTVGEVTPEVELVEVVEGEVPGP